MLPDYEDIRKRIQIAPLWYDDNGTPRYDRFNPDMLGVYDQWAMCVEIACQRCGIRFLVGRGWTREAFCKHGVEFRDLPSREDVESFHYGDPPRHGCVGDTMNCDDIRVVEFWRKDCKCAGKFHENDCGRFEWRRDPELEIRLDAPGQVAEEK